ncbi:hypothetical protein [Sphingobium aromaticiconvertens]|uniref:hypothetical protein n=1 Tax=Sphingobium aromaticiconvertens TaxID=365341 RepID=UPI00301A2602
MEYVDRVIESVTMTLDGGIYIRVTFRNCELFYAGGSMKIDDVHFENCTMKLIEGAESTHKLLTTLCRGGGLDAIPFYHGQ